MAKMSFPSGRQRDVLSLLVMLSVRVLVGIMGSGCHNKIHELGDLTNNNLFSYTPKSYMSKVKVSANLFFS